jgi:DNA-binding response OmpR family regulator
MLRLFARHPGEVVSRETFLEEVWGCPGTLETRTIDNFVRKLRHALEDDPRKPRHILAVRGAGYRFVP